MAVRSKRLAATLVAAPAAVTLYTVPVGRTTILQYLTLYCRGTGTGALRLLLRSGALVIGIARVPEVSLEVTYIDTWIVMHAGDQLQADGPTQGGSGWWITASGAELLGEPEPATGQLPK